MKKKLLGNQTLIINSKISKKVVSQQNTRELEKIVTKQFNGWRTITVSLTFIPFLTFVLEHFIVWMRTAGLPNFRKLWGRIDGGLEPGSYELWIDNNYQVEPFQGAKSFVLSTTNALGGKNYFLAVCYITVGTLCLLFAFVFCVAYMKKRNNSNSMN